jgi:hypothetical protein
MNGLLADPTDIGEVMNSFVHRLVHNLTRGALLTASGSRSVPNPLVTDVAVRVLPCGHGQHRPPGGAPRIS